MQADCFLIGHPALGNSQPPQYAVGYGGGPQQGGYLARSVEVEGSQRSKAQLIVGIDFVGYRFLISNETY